MAKQLTYEDAALALHCSPRHVRRILKRHRITPIRIGHRTVRIPAEKISRLIIKLLPTHNGHANGKGKR
jgi:excisionase family DNA binding protein